MSAPSAFLSVQGTDIVVNGKPILLKGSALGGWMNQENFISGFSGHEFQLRAAMLDVLGEEKYEYFYDKFLEYFFTDEDAKLFSSLGFNCLRLPVNYRHLEDDMNPRVFKTEGLKHLDRVIDICAKYGIYTVIDLHALPGGQNIDWHSDAGNHQALFWEHKDFQDRAVIIWEHLAAHYKDNTWVGGYNPINEPTDVKHVRLVAYYERIEKAIRAIDPNHALFLDANTFGADFSHFTTPLPNTVYACHDYTTFGFPNPPSLYAGSDEQKSIIKKSFERKIEFMKKNGLPIWNGEFGPVYQNEDDGIANWKEINDTRYAVLKDQLNLYHEAKASWSIWTYKDIGFQGMLYVGKDTEYIKLLKPFLEKKKKYVIDEWGVDDLGVRKIFDPVTEWFVGAAPQIKNRYPKTWNADRWIARMVRNLLLSEEMALEYAEYFRGKSFEELDALAKSFSFENCVQREQLNIILSDDTKRGLVQ